LLPIASIEQDSLIFPVSLTLHSAMLRSTATILDWLADPGQRVRFEKSPVRDGFSKESVFVTIEPKARSHK
jgi:hypothetical protein